MLINEECEPFIFSLSLLRADLTRLAFFAVLLLGVAGILWLRSAGTRTVGIDGGLAEEVGHPLEQSAGYRVVSHVYFLRGSEVEKQKNDDKEDVYLI